VTTQGQTAQLGPTHRAAVVLLSMGVEAAAEIFKRLSRSHSRKLTKAMTEVRSVPGGLRRQVVREFAAQIGANGKADPVSAIVERSLGKEGASEIFDEIDAPSAGPRYFARLSALGPSKLARALKSERPQAIALVLAHIHDASLVAQVLKALPDKQSINVANRMARMEAVSPQIVRIVEAEMERGLAAAGGADPKSLERFFRKLDGPRLLASALVAATPDTRTRVIDLLSESDPQVADRVNDAMFPFDDLARLDDQDIQLVMREVVIEDVAIALKNGPEDVRDALLRNLSERARARVVEEMEFLGKKTAQEIAAAQKRVVSAARRLGDEGKIQLWEEVTDEAAADG